MFKQQVRFQYLMQKTNSLLWLMRKEWKCTPKSPNSTLWAYPEKSVLEKLQILTVKLMEVLHLWQPRDHVVEMSL